MRHARLLILVAAIGLVAAQDQAPPDGVKKDLAALQGVWVITMIEADGQAIPVVNLEWPKFRIAGDKIVEMANATERKELDVSIKLDPTKTPREMDLIEAKANFRIVTHKLIYTLENGELKVAFHFDGPKTPPVAFDTKGKDRPIVVVLKKTP